MSQRRKLEWTTFGSISSTSFSSVIIHETKRWQFCSTIQKPSFCPAFIMRSACGPCPWPSEIESTLRPLPSANLSKESIGSTPGERMNTSGDVFVESL